MGGGKPQASVWSGVGRALPAARRGPGWAPRGHGAQARVLRTNRRPRKPLPFSSCREKAGTAAAGTQQEHPAPSTVTDAQPHLVRGPQKPLLLLSGPWHQMGTVLL